MPTGLYGDALVEQCRNLVFQLVFRLGVRNRDPRAFGLQKERGRDSGLAESDDQHAFVVHVQKSYLNFSVVSANNANTSDAIQKRTMIFDSDQPNNSK